MNPFRRIPPALATRGRHRRGFLSVEFITGLLLLAATFVLLLTIGTKQMRVANRLTDERTATRLAEQTLLSLRASGYAADGVDGGNGLNASTTQTSGGESGSSDRPATILTRLDDAAPAGHAWIAVDATAGTRTIRLIGLVPVKEAQR